MKYVTLTSGLVVRAAILLPILLVVIWLTSATPAAAQTYTVLYRFNHRPDGAYPLAPLVLDAAGNLYGTTSWGGDKNNDGVIFELAPSGAFQVLHYFDPQTGNDARSGLLLDPQGNAYGTTYQGGDSNQGVVYKLSPDLTYTVLHSFDGTDGANPLSELVRDSEGNLYGTTSEGGAFGLGVIFEIDVAGSYSVLYSFPGGDEGGNPYTGLTSDSIGNLYGVTTFYNAGNCGGVFTFVPSSGDYTVLHNFASGGGEGCYPQGRLVIDSNGNLYGTTYFDGLSYGHLGYGTIFRLAPSGVFTTLHTFFQHQSYPVAYGNGSLLDGINPTTGLVRDSAGNLYGTTKTGGTSIFGVVYKLDPPNKQTLLKDYLYDDHYQDGRWPTTALVQDAAGNLYGTTSQGGGLNQDWGVIFKITPQ